MYVFGVDIPLLELQVILSLIVVVYLIILEIEFRQSRRIVKKMDEEELVFSKEVRELRKEVGDIRHICSSVTLGRKKKADEKGAPSEKPKK